MRSSLALAALLATATATAQDLAADTRPPAFWPLQRADNLILQAGPNAGSPGSLAALGRFSCRGNACEPQTAGGASAPAGECVWRGMERRREARARRGRVFANPGTKIWRVQCVGPRACLWPSSASTHSSTGQLIVPGRHPASEMEGAVGGLCLTAPETRDWAPSHAGTLLASAALACPRYCPPAWPSSPCLCAHYVLGGHSRARSRAH